MRIKGTKIKEGRGRCVKFVYSNKGIRSISILDLEASCTYYSFPPPFISCLLVNNGNYYGHDDEVQLYAVYIYI